MTAAVPRRRLAVLVSGSGSNFQAILDAVRHGELDADIAVAISNRPGVRGLERARAAGIPAELVDHTEHASREAFEQALAAVIDRHRADAVVLAGFLRILTPGFVARYQGRLFNIHPSLLPKYPGLHTHQRALDAGDTEAGATVHFVVPELDAGPIVLQARVPVYAGDSADTLAARVLEQEHRIYPLVLHWFCTGRLELAPDGARLDNRLLPPSGLVYSPDLLR